MELNHIFKVRKTLIELLEDRGYKINDIDKNISFEEFIILFDEHKYDILDTNKKIIGYFFKEHKTFGKKDLENIVEKIKETHNDNIHIILILKDKYNVIIEKELANPIYKNVEIFLF